MSGVVNQQNVGIHPERKKRKRLWPVILVASCVFLLLFTGLGVAAGYWALNEYGYLEPTPPTYQVPDRILNFKKRQIVNRLKSDPKNPLTTQRGVKARFVVTYIADDTADSQSVTYYFTSFEKASQTTGWEDLKCAGSTQRYNKVLKDGNEEGRSFYCSSPTPFYQLTVQNVAYTLAPESGPIDPDKLEQMILSLEFAKGAKLEPVVKIPNL